MKLDKFLNLCGVVVGIVAAIFLCKVLFLGADEILLGFPHYSAMSWPSVQMISEKAGQKADAMVSIFFVICALVLQMAAICFDYVDVKISMKRVVIFGVVLFVAIILIVSLIDGNMETKYETEIKKLAAKHYIKDEVGEISKPIKKTAVEHIAEEYFDFRKEDEEENIDFVKGFATFLGYDLPANADFSKFQ